MIPSPPFRILRPILFSAVFILVGLVSASAQSLDISGSAQPSIQTTYYPPEEGFPATLEMTSTLVVPSVINTNGDSGSLNLDYQAPAGEQFNITPDSADDDLYISDYYVASNNVGLSFSGTVSVTFTGLVGTAPTFGDGGSYFGYSFTNEALDLDFNATNLSDFSFTGVQFSFPLSGVGANVNLTQDGPAWIQVSNDSYTGSAPPGNPQLISISPVPEPSGLALLSLGALSLPFLRRLIRRQPR